MHKNIRKKVKTFKLIFCLLPIFAVANIPKEKFQQLAMQNPDKAISSWKQEYENSDNREKIFVLLFTAQAYLNKSDFKNMFVFAEKAENEALLLNDDYAKGNVYLSESGYFYVTGLKIKANQYAKKSIEICQQNKDFPERDLLYSDAQYLLAIYYSLSLSKPDLRKSIPVFKGALKSYENLYKGLKKNDKEIKERINTTTYNIGHLYYEVNKIDSSKIYINKTLTNAPNDFIKNLALNKMGEISYSENKIREALGFFSKSRAFLRKINDPNLINNYHFTAKIYDFLNNKKQRDFYSNLEESFTSKLDADQKKALEYAYSLAENNRKTAENKSLNLQYLITGITILSLLLLGIGIWRHKRRIRLQQEKYDRLLTKMNKEKIKKASKKTYSISSEKEQSILESLDAFETSELFRNKGLSISQLANHLETNPSYLSEIISKHKGQNFNSYVNDLRIKYIINKVRSERKYQSYKIEYLAKDSGFSSRSAFATIFKKATGIPPSDFIQLCKKDLPFTPPTNN